MTVMEAGRHILRVGLVLVGLGMGAAFLDPGSAWAISLDEARASGLVCEGPDGLLRQRGGGADVAALVDRINARRMSAYRDTAQREGVSLDKVQAFMGNRLRAKGGCR